MWQINTYLSQTARHTDSLTDRTYLQDQGTHTNNPTRIEIFLVDTSEMYEKHAYEIILVRVRIVRLSLSCEPNRQAWHTCVTRFISSADSKPGSPTWCQKCIQECIAMHFDSQTIAYCKQLDKWFNLKHCNAVPSTVHCFASRRCTTPAHRISVYCEHQATQP